MATISIMARHFRIAAYGAGVDDKGAREFERVDELFDMRVLFLDLPCRIGDEKRIDWANVHMMTPSHVGSA